VLGLLAGLLGLAPTAAFRTGPTVHQDSPEKRMGHFLCRRISPESILLMDRYIHGLQAAGTSREAIPLRGPSR
jgi:hypothetical protein